MIKATRIRFYLSLLVFVALQPMLKAQCTVDAGANVTICRFQSTGLNATASGGAMPYSYDWNPGAGLSSSTINNPVASPNATTTYTVTITDDLGCTASDWVTVTVNPRPVVNAGSNESVCPTQSVSIGGSPTASGGTPAYTYVWNPAAGLSSAAVANPVATPAITTDYSVTVTDINGCTGSDHAVVTLLVGPVAAFSFGPDNQCAGTTVVFTNASTGSGLTYLWNFGDPASGAGNTSALQHPTHIFNAVGCGTVPYTVTLTVTGASGCTSIIQHTVSVLPRPDPVLDDTDVISPFSNCENNPSPSDPNFSITLNNATANAACITGYSIDWGDGNISNGLTGASFPITHNYTQLGAFNLVFTAIGTNGCQGVTTYTVANQSNPAIGITSFGGTAGCAPQTFNFIVSGHQNNSPGTYYVIDFGDGTAPLNVSHAALLTNDTITHTFSTSSCGSGLPGNQFTVTATAFNACASTPASVSAIKVYTNPVASFSHNPAIGCINTNFCFVNQTVPGYGFNCSTATTWLWDFGDGTTSPALNPCHVYTVPGTYAVTLSATNYCGTTFFADSVCINAPPASAFTPDNLTGCAPFAVSVTNQSSTLNTCGTSTYTWSVVYVSSVCAPTPGSWSYTGGTNQNSINPSFIFNNPGTYTLRLSVTNACSTVLSSQNIIVKTVPSIVLNPVSNICGSGTINPSATFNQCYGTISAYNWSFPGGTPSVSSLPSPGAITYITAGAETITLSATNECGTTNASTNFSIFPLPVAAAANPQTVCAGTSVSLGGSPTASGGTGPYTYAWTSMPAGFTSTNVNPSATPAVTTNYTVTVRDSHGCTASASVLITVNPRPTVTVNSLAVCNGNPASLNATVTGGTAPYTYLWTTGAVTSGISVTPGVTTSYTVTVTDSSATGCTAMASGTVTVRPNPTVTTNNPSICAGGSVNLTATGAGSTSPYSYSWSTGGITQTINVSPGATTTYTVTVTDNSTTHCTNLTNAVVTVNPLPTVSVSGDTICSGTAAMLTATAVGATAPYTYLWNNSAITQSINISPLVTTTYTVTVSDGTSTHCTASATGTVLVRPNPIVTIANQAVCTGDSATLTANISAGIPPYTLLWNTGDTSVSITETPVGTTSYTVTVTESSSSQCFSITSGTITINPLPVVNAGPDQTLCDQMIPYTLAGYSPAGGTWSGPGVTAGGVFTPGLVGVGSYNLVYTYTNVNGCINSDTVVMVVAGALSAFAGNDTTVCLNSTQIQCVGTPAGGTWSGSALVTPGGNFVPSSSGTFTLTYTYGASTCLSTDNKIITVNPLPVVTAGTAQSVCVDALPFNLSGATPAGGTWSGTGITDSVSGTFEAGVAGPGTFVLSYSYTDPAITCVNSANKNITVNPLPVVNAGTDQMLCNQMIPFTLTGYSPAGGTWSGTAVTAAGVFTPGVAGAGSFTLTYTYTNGNGCTNSDSVVMTVVNPAVANAGSDTAVCINSGQFQCTGTPSGGTWSGSALVAPGGIFVPTASGTYNLTYTYGAGTCLTTDGKTIIVNSLPVVVAGNNLAVCIDVVPFNLSGSSPAGGTWSGTGITDAANGTFTPIVAGAGTYILTYTFTDPVTSCTNASTLSITVNPLPVASFSHDSLVCANAPVTFLNNSSGAGTYLWDFGDGNTSGTVNPSNTYASAGIFNVSLIAYSPQGCTDTTLGIIHVIGAPVAEFSLSPPSGCGPLSVNFSNTTTGDYTTYSWNFGNGQSSTQQNPAAVLYDMVLYTDTTYYVLLSATNMCGTSSAIDSVRITYPPHADFGTNVNSGCSTVSVAFSNITTGLPQSFLWDFGDGTTGTTTQTTFTHDYSAAANDTTYYITLIAYNVCGSDTMIHSILVQPNPINAFFNTNITHGCAPLVVNFANYSTGNGITNNNSWNFGDGNISSQMNPSHTFTTPGTYIVSLAVNNVCSYDTAYVTITVFPFPVVNFSLNPATICVGQAATIINNSLNITNTEWNFGDGGSSSLFNPVHVFTSQGTYQITLAGTSFDGCIDSSARTLTVLSLPIVNAGPDQIFCVSNAPTQLTGFSPAGGSWSGPGVSAGGVFSAASTGAGHFNLVYTYTGPNGCANADSISADVIVQPVSDAGSDMSVCISTSQVQLSGAPAGGTWSGLFISGSGLFNVPAVGNYPLVYSYGPANCVAHDSMIITVSPLPVVDAGFGQSVCLDAIPFNLSGTPAGGYWSGTGIINAAQGLYNPSVAGIGNFTATYTFTDPLTQCVNSDSLIITVTPLPQPDITASALSGCQPLTVYFLNSSLYASDYLWLFGDGDSSEAVSPSHTFTESGHYTVTVYASSALGCTGSYTMDVEVYPLPIADVGLGPVDGCVPFTFTFPNVSVLGDTFFWDFGDGGTSTMSNPTHTYFSPGEFTVTLTATSVNGCVNVQTNNGLVLVHPQPQAGFFPDPYVTNISESTIQFVDQSEMAETWNWYFGDGGTAINQFPYHTYTDTGTFFVMQFVSNEWGCSDSASGVVRINDFFTFYAPNAFTPNGDGINDVFLVKGTGIDLNHFTMYIYDRWGKMIFRTGDINEGWDGRVQDQEKICPEGVFTYLILVNDNTNIIHKYTGTVTLIH